MADPDSSNDVDQGKSSTRATRKTAKRVQSSSTKKAPAPKKSKSSSRIGKVKGSAAPKGKPKTQSSPKKETHNESQDANGQGSDTIDEPKSAISDTENSKSPNKMSIEERRKVIQAERLRKQEEMEALLAQEEALLLAVENEDRPKAEAEVGMDVSAESYGTRSEVEESQDEGAVQEGEDNFEDMEEPANSEHEADANAGEVTSRGQSMEEEPLPASESVGEGEGGESHEPPHEAGLAGLDDDEDEEFADEEDMGDGEDSGEGTGRAISPVTWDVDVHANPDDDNISVDSPIHSDNDSDKGEEIDKEKSKKSPALAEAKSPPAAAETTKSTKIPTTPSEHAKSERISAHQRLSTGDVERPSERKGIDAAEAMRPRVHKYLYREAKYFMVKSSNHENVRLAKAKGVWSTPPQNEIRFNKAVEENTTVILVFSVKESGAFQGFARINGPSQKDGPKIAWVLPPGISAKALSGVFKLDWISRTDLSFPRTGPLRNPWNQNKPIKIARDGQEIEPHAGESLCKLFTLDGSSDYERVISRVKRKREALQAKGPTNSSGSGGGSGSRPPYRPVSNHSHNRDSHSDYRGRGGRGSAFRGNYRGGRGGGGYRGGPPSSHNYSSSRHHGMNHASPHHQNYPPQAPNQYYSSGGGGSGGGGPNSRTSSYGDYRNRNSYQSGHPSYQQPPPPNYYHNTVVPTDIIVKGSYEQYLDQMRRTGTYIPDMGNSMSMYDPYSASYHAGGRDAPPPPPIPSYSSSRDRDRDRPGRPSADRYDRAVEDFLRRTSGGGGGSSRSSRGADPRADPRADHRYKDPRDPRESRADPRDYHRARSRSRDRERAHRERR